MITNTSTRLSLAGALLAFLALFGACPARAESVPTLVHFQGRLTDAANNPLTGPNNFVFQVYDASSGGNPLWGEAQPAVAVANGVFAVQLGAVTPLVSGVFASPAAYLQVTVNGNPMSPRQRLLTSPYSHNAQLLGGRDYTALVSTDAATQSIAGAKTFTGTVFVPAPTLPGHAATKAYVDSAGGNNLLIATSTWSGQNTFTNLVMVSSELVVTGMLNRDSALSVGGPLSVAFISVSSITTAGAGVVVSTNLFITQGRVGVGTTSPDGTLSVSGPGWLTPVLAVKATVPGHYGSIDFYGGPGIVGLNRFQFGQYETGSAFFYQMTAKDIDFYTSALKRMTVKGSGNVGIGTASPAYRLVVSSGAGETGTIMAVSTGATDLFWVAGDGAHATKYYGDGSGLSNVAVAGDSLGSHIATTTLDMATYDIVGVSTISVSSITTTGAGVVVSTNLFITQGNFGIGTTNPISKLTVNGYGADPAGITDFRVTGYGPYGAGFNLISTAVGGRAYAFGSTGPGAAFGAGKFTIYSGGYVFSVTQYGEYINGFNQYTPLGQLSVFPRLTTTKGLVLRGVAGQTADLFQAQNSAGTSLMEIDATGRVGIGAASPAAALHVSSAATAAATPIFIVSSGTAVGQELLLVQKDGNVGIGTTGPNARLQVVGGDVYVQTQANGVILRDTDGAGCHRITANTAGTIAATVVTCP